MSSHVDTKGKYFTPRVNKEPVRSIIRTTEYVIIGDVFVRPDQRLKDELGHDTERFFAVTNACVHDARGEELLFESSFLLVAYQQVVLLSPLEALSNVNTAWQQIKQEDAK